MEALHGATHRKARPELQAPTRPEVAHFLPVRVVEATADGDRERPLAVSPPSIQVLLGGVSPSAPGSTPTSSAAWSMLWSRLDPELAAHRPHLHRPRYARPSPATT